MYVKHVLTQRGLTNVRNNRMDSVTNVSRWRSRSDSCRGNFYVEFGGLDER